MKTLPDKWCIRFKNKEQAEIIIGYFSEINSLYNNYYYTGEDRAFSSECNYSPNIDTFLMKGFKEITLQDFKELVLKEKPMKYTIAQLTDPKNKYVVFIETKEQWDKLKTTKAKLTSYFYGSYCYNLIRRTYSSNSTKNDVGGYPKDSKIIYFDQIDFEEEIMVQNKEKLIELKENLDKVKETYLNTIKEVIPEYVLCTKQLGYCIVGKVYKTEKKNKSFRWLYEEFNCNITQLINQYDYFGRLEATMKYFIPATKEQYEAQNTPKFKVGDWVYHGNLDQAYLITEFVSTNLFKASFGHFSDSGWLDIRPCTKATEKQIKDSLLKEAEKRYPIGTRFIGLGSQEEEISEGYHHFYCGDEKFIAVNIDMGVVYRNGKWAEIIPEVEKWSVGTYVVFLSNDINDNNKEIGDIEKIVRLSVNKEIFYYQDGYCNGINNPGIQWFATKEEAEEFAKTLKPKGVTLPFGNLEFTIDKKLQTAECREGVITKQQIQEIVDWLTIPLCDLPGFHRISPNNFKLLGYTMQLVDNGTCSLQFGCCIGTFNEAKAIYKAMQ